MPPLVKLWSIVKITESNLFAILEKWSIHRFTPLHNLSQSYLISFNSHLSHLKIFVFRVYNGLDWRPCNSFRSIKEIHREQRKIGSDPVTFKKKNTMKHPILSPTKWSIGTHALLSYSFGDNTYVMNTALNRLSANMQTKIWFYSRLSRFPFVENLRWFQQHTIIGKEVVLFGPCSWF